MSLEVYYDLFSQPSRAVVLFCKVNGIPFIPKPVTLKKCEYFYFNTFFHHDPCRDICSPPYVGEPIPVSIGCQSWVVCQVVTLTTSSIYNVWSDIWHFVPWTDVWAVKLSGRRVVCRTTWRLRQLDLRITRQLFASRHLRRPYRCGGFSLPPCSVFRVT